MPLSARRLSSSGSSDPKDSLLSDSLSRKEMGVPDFDGTVSLAIYLGSDVFRGVCCREPMVWQSSESPVSYPFGVLALALYSLELTLAGFDTLRWNAFVKHFRWFRSCSETVFTSCIMAALSLLPKKRDLSWASYVLVDGEDHPLQAGFGAARAFGAIEPRCLDDLEVISSYLVGNFADAERQRSGQSIWGPPSIYCLKPFGLAGVEVAMMVNMNWVNGVSSRHARLFAWLASLAVIAIHGPGIVSTSVLLGVDKFVERLEIAPNWTSSPKKLSDSTLDQFRYTFIGSEVWGCKWCDLRNCVGPRYKDVTK